MRVPAVVGTVCLVLAAAAGWGNVLLVILGQVIPGWAVSAALLVVSLVLMRVVVRSTTEPSRRPARARVLRGLLVAAAGLGCAVGVLDDLGSSSDYRVLEPTGPNGCTAVVRETSFLKIGNGEVYAVGPVGIAMWRSGSWVVDDGYRPIAEGTYDLRWGRDGGTLAIRGTEGDPVVGGGLHEIDCGWGA